MAKLTVDGVIGFAFMIAHNCVLDIATKTLKIGPQIVSLLSEGAIGCYRVAVSDTLSIPPRTEIVTKVNYVYQKEFTFLKASEL